MSPCQRSSKDLEASEDSQLQKKALHHFESNFGGMLKENMNLSKKINSCIERTEENKERLTSRNTHSSSDSVVLLFEHVWLAKGTGTLPSIVIVGLLLDVTGWFI